MNQSKPFKFEFIDSINMIITTPCSHNLIANVGSGGQYSFVIKLMKYGSHIQYEICASKGKYHTWIV